MCLEVSGSVRKCPEVSGISFYFVLYHYYKFSHHFTSFLMVFNDFQFVSIDSHNCTSFFNNFFDFFEVAA